MVLTCKQASKHTHACAQRSPTSVGLAQARPNNYKQTTKSTVCVNYDYATGYNTAVIQFCGNKSAKFPGKSWHITEQFYDFAQP